MKETKSEKIEAKITKREYEKVIQMASENNMSVAELVRARVLFDPVPEHTPFEKKVLKALSANTALVQLIVEKKLTDQEYAVFEEELKIIEKKNGLEESFESRTTENQQ